MLFQKSLRLFVGLRSTFGPVSAAPGSAHAFLAQDSLCSALSRDIRCAQSGIESPHYDAPRNIRTHTLGLQSSLSPRPWCVLLMKIIKKPSGWPAFVLPRRDTQRSRSFFCLLRSLSLSSSAPSFRILSCFSMGHASCFLQEKRMPPRAKKKREGVWLVVTRSKELNSQVTLSLRWEWEPIRRMDWSVQYCICLCMWVSDK